MMKFFKSAYEWVITCFIIALRGRLVDYKTGSFIVVVLIAIFGFYKTVFVDYYER